MTRVVGMPGLYSVEGAFVHRGTVFLKLSGSYL